MSEQVSKASEHLLDKELAYKLTVDIGSGMHSHDALDKIGQFVNPGLSQEELKKMQIRALIGAAIITSKEQLTDSQGRAIPRKRREDIIFIYERPLIENFKIYPEEAKRILKMGMEGAGKEFREELRRIQKLQEVRTARKNKKVLAK